MTIITQCHECGYAPAKLINQSDQADVPPEPGNFWLCSICGLVHVYRLARPDLLVTLAPTVAELFLAVLTVPEMLAMAQEIRERGPQPILTQDNGGKLS